MSDHLTSNPERVLREAMEEFIAEARKMLEAAELTENVPLQGWLRARINIARAALLKARPPSEATGIYDSAWVIEGMWSSTAYPEYWVGSSAWSSDPYKALRFASKQSAQQAADMMLVGINHRVACHEFAGNSHHE